MAIAKALFDLDGNVIKGSFPVRAEKLVREWTQKRRPELMNAWALCASKQQPNKIEPLE
jgi:hypothetical protein